LQVWIDKPLRELHSGTKEPGRKRASIVKLLDAFCNLDKGHLHHILCQRTIVHDHVRGVYSLHLIAAHQRFEPG
jgi:hypothetical protein